MISATHMQRLLALKLDPEPMSEVLSIIAEVAASQNVSEPSPGALRQRRWRERLRTSPSVTEASPSVSEASPRDVSYIDNNLSTSKNYINSKKDLCRKASPRNAYPPLFETFWKTYPTDKNMGKLEAFNVFKTLSLEDQQAAIASISGFKTYLAKNPDQRVVHACRYLKWRRFDGYTTGTSLSESERAERLRRLSA